MILLAVLLCLGGAVALVLFTNLSRGIAQRLGQDFAVRHVLWQQARVGGLLARDLALSGKLVESPLVRRWLAHEDDPELTRQALAEFNSFGRFFSSGNWFAASRQSSNYYINDAAGSRSGNEFVNTMSPQRQGDEWFYTSLNHPARFHLNVDRNVDLGVTNVWINMAVEDEEGNRLGIAGTGVDLSAFIAEFIHSEEEGVSTMLLDPSGAILAHEDPRYITANLHSQDPDQWTMFFDLLEREQDRATVRAALERVASGAAESATFNLTMADRNYVAALAPVPEISWLSLALVDLDQVMGVRQLTGLGLLLGGTMLLIVFALALLLDRLVLVPIRAAAAGAGKIAAGDYRSRLPTGRQDEIGELSSAFNRMAATVEEHTRTLEERVAARTEELREANHQLTAGILYARHLQASLLPAEEQIRRLLPDSFLIWEQRDGVGGDFCLLYQDQQRWLVGVADCTGHGVAGALMTMTAHMVFRQVVEELGLEHPGRLLTAMNQRLRAVLHGADSGPSASGVNDPRVQPGGSGHGGPQAPLPSDRLRRGQPDNGLELALAVYHRATGTLTFAGAGPALYAVAAPADEAAAGEVTVIRGDRHSVGYRRSDPEHLFAEHEIRCSSGTIYYLVTDGILDQVGGPKGISFGNRRFRQLLAGLAGRDPATCKATITTALADYQGAATRRDDLTVLGFMVPEKPA